MSGVQLQLVQRCREDKGGRCITPQSPPSQNGGKPPAASCRLLPPPPGTLRPLAAESGATRDGPDSLDPATQQWRPDSPILLHRKCHWVVTHSSVASNDGLGAADLFFGPEKLEATAMNLLLFSRALFDRQQSKGSHHMLPNIVLLIYFFDKSSQPTKVDFTFLITSKIRLVLHHISFF